MPNARRLFALFALAACASCDPPSPAPDPGARASASAPPAALASGQAAAPANADFARFVDDYFEAQFAFSPVGGTEVGLHKYDPLFPDRSRAAHEKRAAELKALGERLATIDRAKLSFDEQIDATALEADLRATLFHLETLREWESNPMMYAGTPGGAVDGLIKRDFAPAAERLRAVVARLEKVPALYEAAKQNVKNPPKEFTDLAVRMAGGSVGYFEKTLPGWAKQAAGSDAALFASFEAANKKVVEATKAFSAWLKADLKPRSKGKYAIGAEHFATLLKLEEMVEAPLDEVLARGEAQLQKDYDAFVATAKLIDAKKTPAQVMKALSDEHPTADDLIPSVRRTVEEARRFLVDKGLVTVPSEVRPRIEETPPFQRSGGFASMDTPGPFEAKATEAFYYVTPVEAEWDKKHKEEHLRLFNPYVVAMINVHEAFPGHYLQFLYAPKFPTKTRKLVGAGTNSEGWAHYTEQMMVDEGFGGQNPKIRLAQLQEALLRDCRYVVGIKLHTAGWTVEQGAKLFEEKGFQEPANAYEESRRGAYNPTYLYYTLGKLEIQKLRDEYRAKTGAGLKQFHDAFVSQGALPIPLVRKILLRDAKG
ncbi:MAG TPA: DUF885 domain-containing protein [Polyangiaceae bacterium]|nr:DUF885 domain-containing protein [Polyangiaceae bacterium]